jgi:hypothetical protein
MPSAGTKKKATAEPKRIAASRRPATADMALPASERMEILEPPAHHEADEGRGEGSHRGEEGVRRPPSPHGLRWRRVKIPAAKEARERWRSCGGEVAMRRSEGEAPPFRSGQKLGHEDGEDENHLSRGQAVAKELRCLVPNREAKRA